MKLKLDVSNRVRYLREFRNLTQESVAIDLGITQQAYQQIENGSSKVDIDRINALATIFGLSIEAFLSFKPSGMLKDCMDYESSNNFQTQNSLELAYLKKELERLESKNTHLRNQNMILSKIVSKLSK